jgi:hypothetical protein
MDVSRFIRRSLSASATRVSTSRTEPRATEGSARTPSETRAPFPQRCSPAPRLLVRPVTRGFSDPAALTAPRQCRWRQPDPSPFATRSSFDDLPQQPPGLHAESCSRVPTATSPFYFVTDISYAIQATAYCWVTSLPADLSTSLNSSGLSSGSSRSSRWKPAAFSSFLA